MTMINPDQDPAADQDHRFVNPPIDIARMNAEDDQAAAAADAELDAELDRAEFGFEPHRTADQREHDAVLWAILCSTRVNGFRPDDRGPTGGRLRACGFEHDNEDHHLSGPYTVEPTEPPAKSAPTTFREMVRSDPQAVILVAIAGYRLSQSIRALIGALRYARRPR